LHSVGVGFQPLCKRRRSPALCRAMGSERRTLAVGRRRGPGQQVSRVALWAADDVLADRIRQALTLNGHEVAGRCLDPLELTEDFHLLGAQLILAAVKPREDAVRLAFLCRQLPEVPKIAVVAEMGGISSRRLLAAEIDGLVLEQTLERTLAPAVAAVLAGQLCVPSEARSALAGPVFSHREKQVLRLLLAGLTNSQIAEQLFLSESTVKSHLSSSFRKLGVSSRAEVLRRARSSDGALPFPVSPAPVADYLSPIPA
jgi:DNA-binding NarL/FixJ family response regulator